jgi:LysW-gamma-L-lysine carboxypeptidase
MEHSYPENLLRRMLEVYSPSGHEEGISKLLAAEMAQLGYEVSVDEVGNVEGRAGSGSPKILLCGHMDTVEGFIDVKKKGKVIFGRGAVDAKSPLAALICAGARHIQDGGKGAVLVLGVVDEEGKSNGMKHYMSRAKEDFDFAIFGEPSSAYAVTVGYKGRIVFTVACKTSPGHASAPQLFENAAYVAIRLIERLRALDADWKGKGNGDLFEIPTLCVTLIKGGTQDNTVPGNCELTVDVRVPLSIGVQALKTQITRITDEFKASEPRSEIAVTFIDENEPFQEESGSKLVRAFIEAVEEEKGKDCRLSRKTGTSDVNDFVRRFKTSAVVYGPGNSKLDHTPLENVSIEEFYDSIEILTRVLKKISG